MNADKYRGEEKIGGVGERKRMRKMSEQAGKAGRRRRRRRRRRRSVGTELFADPNIEQACSTYLT